MKTIFSKVKLRSGQIVQLFLLVLLSAVGQMLLPSFLAQMISHGVAEGENRIVWMYAVIMAGVTLFSCVISFLSVKIASYISTDFAAQLRTQVFSKVQGVLGGRDGSVRNSESCHKKHFGYYECTELFDIAA